MRPITMMMSQWKAEQKQGQTLEFENCKGGYFSTVENFGLKVTGRTEQQTLIGKNLLDISSAVSDSRNGVTVIKRDDGSFQISGTSSGAYNYYINRHIALKAGNYKLCLVGNLTGANLRVYKNGIISSHITNGSYVNFTLTQDENDVTVYLNVVRAETECNGTFYPMIIRADDDFSVYEPYCGGMPAPNPRFPMPIRCVKAGTQIVCGNTVTVPCDLYEGDIWFPTSGKVLKYNCKIELPTDGDYRSYPPDEPNGIATPPILAQACTRVEGLCNREKRAAAVGKGSSYMWVGVNNKRIYWIGIYTALGISTVDEFKHWVSENATEVVYKLDTPITEQYTPQPVFAPKGRANVSQIPTDLTADLSAYHLVRR